MSYIERTFTVGDYTIEIRSDTDAESPDAWENADIFLAYDCRRVGAGRKGYARGGADHLRDYHVFTLGVNDGPYTILYLGSAVVAPDGDDDDDGDYTDTGPGYVYVSRKEWPDAGDARKAAAALVAEWCDYLAGNVYGYVIKDREGEQVDSCWGFIGDPDASGVVESATAEAEALVSADARDAATARDAGHDPATAPDGSDTDGPDARE